MIWISTGGQRWWWTCSELIVPYSLSALHFTYEVVVVNGDDDQI